MDLEEKAAELGESGLAICLSKPLMRLGKLPLLMQNLLYHTDAAASFEYEKVSQGERHQCMNYADNDGPEDPVNGA